MDEILFNKIQDFRYERKFVVEDWSYDDLFHMVRLHPAVFREIYQERRVNNFYFDTLFYRNYHDNMDGVSRRSKVRVRWYGETFGQVNQPVLELKFKRNLHVGKLSFPLRPFPLERPFLARGLQNVFAESDLDPVLRTHLRGMRLSLLNCYERRYFCTADRHFRLTLDRNLLFFPVHDAENWFPRPQGREEQLVVELKYHSRHDMDAGGVLEALPFRLTRSSKYVQGVQTVF